MLDNDPKCVFCQIIDGALPGSFVYRDELVSVFMDIHPINPGHLLVVPNVHSESVTDVAPLTAARMFQVAQSMVKTLRQTPHLQLKYEAANIFLSEGAVAGQEIPHAHLHVTPRFKGDGHRMGFSGTDAESGDRDRLNQIASGLHRGLLQLKSVEVVLSPKVHFAKPSDILAWSVMRDLLWPGSSLAAHAQDAEAMLQRPDVAVLIVKEENQTVGFAEVSVRAFANGCDTSPVAFLEGIYISPPFRRRGLAKQLIDSLARWARHMGVRELGSDTLVDNEESIRAHQSWGFQQTEQVQYLRLQI